MRASPSLAALSLATLLVAGTPALADVAVHFVEPQRYSDAGRYGVEQERNLRALERHFATLGERCLRAGETLELRVLDVDLAGRHEWWHRSAYDVRVMRDITWPRLELEYLWRDANGAVLGDRRERVVDMSYLWHGAARHDATPLPYERAMLRDWFERRFCGERRMSSS